MTIYEQVICPDYLNGPGEFLASSNHILDEFRMKGSVRNLSRFGTYSGHIHLSGIYPNYLDGYFMDKFRTSFFYRVGIIIYEVFNGFPLYHDMAHEEFLAVKICQGLRPRFHTNVPQLVKDLAKQCVDADPLRRPAAEHLYRKFNHLYFYDSKKFDEIDEFNEEQQSSSTNDTELR